MSNKFAYPFNPINWPASPHDYTGNNRLGIYTQETTQRYMYGTRHITWDGRVFKYGKCGSVSIASMKRGVQNKNILVQEKATTCGAAIAGAEVVTVTFNGDYDDGTHAKDELQGGFISIYNSSTVRDQRMIIGNDAIATGGGATKIYLEGPISTTFSSTVDCEVMTNPYNNLAGGGDLYSSTMGIPCILATATYNFWIQTWGICRFSPVSAELGVDQNLRQLVFSSNSGLRSTDAMDALDNSEQMAGFIINRNPGSAGSAAPFVMLQISI